VSTNTLLPPSNAIRTRTCSLWFDRIIYGRFHDGAEVTGEDAHENLAGIADFTRGRRMPVLVDLRPVRSQSAEARAVFAGPEAAAVSAAVALVFDSPLTRVLGNFYLGFNKPLTPSRLFNSVTEAELWLYGFLEPEQGR
jgi:hypothetical protein